MARTKSVCKTCGKTFLTVRQGSDECYHCALTRITHNQCPEEGDFNTALLISGEMTEEEAYLLQKDLESVEVAGDPDPYGY